MPFGTEQIMTMLLGDENVLSKLSTFIDSNNEVHPAIYNNSKLPHSNELKRTLTFYRIDEIDGSKEYFDYEYRFACRSKDYSESEDLGVAVFNLFNRYSANGYVIKANLRTTIAPRDENDDPNTPVDVRIMYNGML